MDTVTDANVHSMQIEISLWRQKAQNSGNFAITSTGWHKRCINLPPMRNHQSTNGQPEGMPSIIVRNVSDILNNVV